MTNLSCISDAQMARIDHFISHLHGIARVDDRRVLSSIIHVIRNSMRWRGAAASDGPHETPFNSFMRWSRLGKFNRIFAGLAGEADEHDLPLIDVSRHTAPRRASSKGALHRRIGRTKGGLNSKLHAVCNDHGRPVASLCRKVR